MRLFRILLAMSTVAVLLSGCAASTAAEPAAAETAGTRTSTASPSPSPSPLPSETPEPEPPTKADVWLDGLVLPAGAVPVDAIPEGAHFDPGAYVPPCAPIDRQNGLWFIPGAQFAETRNWLIEHPSAGLMVPGFQPWPEDPQVGSAMMSNVPARGSLEGIVFKIARADGGVAIRVEIYAFSDETVCRTPPPGTQWGGPGMG
ncbi:hypothetical protein [Microbacterium paludicola]|uniref:hypothetical protein n=1 Tax=Microbacterium paludicola TaxID=300019 RepID=UPI0031D2BEBD